jgi:hypothetical protein
MHKQGVVENVPGLYFVGLHFLYAMSSASLIGVGRDAERIVKHITRRVRTGAGRFYAGENTVVAMPWSADTQSRRAPEPVSYREA